FSQRQFSNLDGTTLNCIHLHIDIHVNGLNALFLFGMVADYKGGVAYGNDFSSLPASTRDRI
ncbi:MAG: hypothetical protein AAF050_23400, partial [Cyanobacteria bacterium J06649_5]